MAVPFHDCGSCCSHADGVARCAPIDGRRAALRRRPARLTLTSIRHLNGGTHVGTPQRSRQISEGSHTKVASSLAPSTIDRGAPCSHPHAHQFCQPHRRRGLILPGRPRRVRIATSSCSRWRFGSATPATPERRTPHERQTATRPHERPAHRGR